MNLINGVDYAGQTPGDLLYSDGFTAPTSQPRVVKLGRCICGDPECEAVTARVYALDERTIVWDTIQVGTSQAEDTAAPRPRADAILFDRQQYHRTIDRTRLLFEHRKLGSTPEEIDQAVVEYLRAEDEDT